MADKKVKTTLEIGVEDRQVKRLGETIKKALSAQPIQDFRKAVQQMSREVSAAKFRPRLGDPNPLSQINQGGGSARERQSGGSSGGGGGGRGPAARPPMGFGMTALAAGVGSMGASALSRGGGAATAGAGGFGAVSGGISAIPWIGAPLAAMMHTAESLTDTAVAFKTTMAHGFGQSGVAHLGGPLMDMAQKLGIGPQELAGRIGEIGQTSGLKGNQLKALAPKELEFEQLTGTRAGTLAGAAGRSGGNVTPESAAKLNRQAMQSAIVAGFKEGKWSEYLQQVASDIEGLRSQGILVDPRSIFAVTQLLGGTKAAGLQGEAGFGVAKTMEEKITHAGQGSDLTSAVAVSTAMKMNPGKSGSWVIRDMNKHWKTYFVPVLKQLVAMGGGKDSATMFLMSQFPFSADQAESIYDEVKKGTISQERLDEIMSGGTGAADDKFEKLKGERESMSALPAQAAELERKKIDVGGDPNVSGGVYKTRRAEMKLAARVAPIGGKLAEAGGKLIEGGLNAYDKGGMGGLMGYAGEQLKGLLNAAMKKVGDVFDDINKKISKAMGMGPSVSMGDAFSKKGMQEIFDFLLDGLKDTFKQFIDWLNSMLPSFMKLPGGHGADRGSPPPSSSSSRLFDLSLPSLIGGASGLE